MRRLIIPILIGGSLLACVKDISFEDIPSESQPIVQGIFQKGEAPQLTITSSTTLNSSEVSNPLSGAKVELYHADQLVGEFTEVSSGQYESNFQDYVSGDHLAVKIETEYFAELTANTVVPYDINIDMLMDSIPIFGYDDMAYYELKITIKDNPDEENFYDLEAWSKTYGQLFGGEEFTRTYLNTDDPLITNQGYYSPFPFIYGGLKSMPFSDNSFNGKEKTLIVKIFPKSYSLNMDSYTLPEADYLIRLKAITRDQFLFTSSVLSHLQGRESDLIFGSGMPADIISNINGGTGLFACENVYEYSIHVESVNIKK